MAANADDSYNSLDQIRNSLPRIPTPYNNKKSSPISQDSQDQGSSSNPDEYQSLQHVRNALTGAPDASNDDQDSMMNQISKIPGYAVNAAENLPGQMWGMAQQIPDALKKVMLHPNQAGMDILGGAAHQEQNLGSAILEGGEYLTRKGAEGIGKLTGNPVNVPKWNAREFAGLEGNNQVDLGKMVAGKNPDPLLYGAGQYGLGGAAAGAKVLPMMAANSATAAMDAQPGDRLQAGVTGAVDTMLPPAAMKGAMKGGNALRPSNLLRGNLSPEELQANLEASQGTNTNLGDVIGSPTLKRIYENVLPNVPLSGAFTKMQQTANQITSKGEDLMGKIGENLPEGDKTQILQNALKSASREAAQDKNANFRKVNQIADDSGLVVGRDKFQAKAREILGDISQSPELEREFPADLKDDLNSYASGNAGNSLKLSNIFKGKLNDKANDLYIGGKKYESGLVRELRDSLGEDINDSIKASKSDELKSAYDTAQKEYGSKFAPFEDPDIVKFTREGGDADLMLSHFLKGGSNDRGNLLSKLTTKLPEGLQGLPLHMYLSKAIDESGNLNPPKFRTLYKNLGEKQRDALVPDTAMRKQLDKYVRTVGLNSDTFNTMFNPKTGQRNLDSAIGALEGMLAYSHPLKAGAGMILGRSATKALTSEALRKSLVNKMIKQKK